MPDFDYTNQNHVTVLLLVIIIIFLIIVIARYKLKAYFDELKIKKRFERADKLELQARSFLKSKGYSIVDYQSTYTHRYMVDGKVLEVDIQPDYIVKKGGKKYIVEVKSGHSATSAQYRNTRRQLLEYDYVVENNGVFLLDMESRQLKLVQFKTKAEKRSSRLIKAIIIVAIAGIAIPFWQAKIVIGVILGLIFIKESRF
ncbi:MAG: CRISPR-associated protein Cas4 [Carboxylicivirga sp.]|jgi:Holliday junction resolvase-like predicted endonuclease|nr:CRISPR-associated protein Cas4 [Carboxylicivirga sp.]